MKQTVAIGDTGGELVSKLSNNFDELYNDITNISDFLGISPNGSGLEDQTNIQTAINAASAAGGGTVVIYAGTYYITAPVVLKSYVSINIDKNAVFTFPALYNQQMFIDDGGILLNCYVSGGRFTCNTSMDFMVLRSLSPANIILYCKFFDIYVESARYMFNVTASTGGYINFNSFYRLTSWNNVGTWFTTYVAPAQIAINTFFDLNLEALGNTVFGFDCKRFVACSFINIKYSDFQVGVFKPSITFDANCANNMVISELNDPPDGLIDLGLENLIISQYTVSIGRRSIVSHGHLVNELYLGSLTDGVPTASEIAACTNSISLHTGGSAGAYNFVKDTTGSGLVYIVVADGTDFYYLPMTKAT